MARFIASIVPSAPCDAILASRPGQDTEATRNELAHLAARRAGSGG